MVASGLLPADLAIPCAVAIIISGALYFADREMKTKDNYFRGFPAVWNVPAFYLLLLKPDPWVAAAAIACSGRRDFPAGSVRASVSRRAAALLTWGCSPLVGAGVVRACGAT